MAILFITIVVGTPGLASMVGPLAGVSRSALTADAQGTPEIVNGGVLQNTWRPTLANSRDRAATIGYVGDSVAEGQGLTAGPDVLTQRIIDQVQSKLRASTDVPFCYPSPSIYHKSSTLIPGWDQSTPLFDARPDQSPGPQSVELPKSQPQNTGWARNSGSGPGGRTANLALPLDEQTGLAAERGTSLTFSGFTMDYYTSAWGRNMEIRLDGRVLNAISTMEQLPAWQYGPRTFSWLDQNGRVASHTVVVTAVRDPRYYQGSVAIGGFTPYDGDQGRCAKVLDLSHGGFGYHFALNNSPQTIRDNVISGSTGRGIDLLILAYGYNDPEYYTPTEFAAAIQSYIDKTRGYGYSGPILLVGMPTPKSSTDWKVRDWAPYLVAMKSKATWRNKAAYIGLDTVVPANPGGGIWSDTVHLNAAGSQQVAQYLSTFLAGAAFATNDYVALGDSYSAGVGTDYNPTDPCYRSPYGYPVLLSDSADLSLTYAACSGATTTDVTNSQLAQLRPDTSYATMTIGGNDLGFAEVLGKCADPRTSDSDCTDLINSKQPLLDALPAKLSTLYGKIRSRAPSADIAIAGYPRIFTDTCLTSSGSMSTPNANLINSKIDTLNGHKKRATTSVDFKFVDPVPSFIGHGVCSEAEWINGVSTDPTDREDLWRDSFHPNRVGNQQYAYLYHSSFGIPGSISRPVAAPTPSVSDDAARLPEAMRSDYVAGLKQRGATVNGSYTKRLRQLGWQAAGVDAFVADLNSGDKRREIAAINWWYSNRKARQQNVD